MGELVILLRITIIISYIFFAVGTAISIFNHYNINYMFIFQCDHENRMTPAQLFKVGGLILCFSSMCLSLTLFQIYYLKDIDYPFWACTVLIIFLVCYCF